MSDVDKREERPGCGDFTTPVKSESHRKHVPFSPSARSCGTPREEELSNSLMNLKLGFKQREEQLQLQLAIHKEAIYELHELNQKLRLALNSVGATVCDQLVAAEELAELSEQQESSDHAQRSALAELQQQISTLTEEKTRLETQNAELALQLEQFQLAVHVEQRDDDNAGTIHASPTSVISDTAGLSPSPGPMLTNGKKSPAMTPWSPAGTNDVKHKRPLSRRHSSGSTGAASEGQNSGSFSPAAKRKPPVPTRDELRTTRSRRSYPSTTTTTSACTPTPRSPRRPLHTNRSAQASKPTTSSTAAGAAKNTDEPPSPSPKPPRVSLRSRIEALSRQDRENNPWLGAFTTTNRTSSGGCQFYVDVHSADFVSEGGSWNVELGESGCEVPDLLRHSSGDSGNDGQVKLLRVESTDLQILSECAQLERIASPQQHLVDGGAQDGHRAELEDCGRVGPVHMDLPDEDVSSLPESAAQVCVSTVDVAPTSETATSAAAGGVPRCASLDSLPAPICRPRSLDLPMLDVPAMSLVDSIQHDEGYAVSPLSDSSPRAAAAVARKHDSGRDLISGSAGVTINAGSGVAGVKEGLVGDDIGTAYKGDEREVGDGFDNIFVELKDADVQCDLILSGSGDAAPRSATTSVSTVEVACNTVEDWRDSLLVSTAQLSADATAAAAAHRAQLDAALKAAIEETKFALGKTLFDLKYGGGKKVIAPPTPLGQRSASTAAPAFADGDSTSAKNKSTAPIGLLSPTKPGAAVPPSTPATGTKNATTKRTLPLVRATPAAHAAGSASAGIGAAPSPALAQLNVELLKRLTQQTALTARGQRKIELLEQKLCRLIMYVKHTAREALEQERSAALAAAAAAVEAPAVGTTEQAIRPTVTTSTGNSKTITAVVGSGSSGGISTGAPSEDPKTAATDGTLDTSAASPLHTAHAVNASMNVGCMSFGAGLNQLLCFEDNDEDEATTPPPHHSFFSPVKDFQGRAYDDHSEMDLSTQSNPLLRRQPQPQGTAAPKTESSRTSARTPARAKDVNRSHLELSFHAERSFLDTPEMASPALSLPNGDACSPIPMSNGPVSTYKLPQPQQQERNSHSAAANRSDFKESSNQRPAALVSSVRSVTAQVRPKLAPITASSSSGTATVGAAAAGATSPMRAVRSPPPSPAKQLFPAVAGADRAQAVAQRPDKGDRVSESAGEDVDVQRQELAEAKLAIRKLEQTVSHLTLRNKNLSREKQLLTAKLQHALENDSDSFHLQIYTASEQIPLNNPTKTMNLVLGFMENNNKLLDEIDAQKAQLQEKSRQLEVQAQQLQEAQRAVIDAEQRNHLLSAEVDSAQRVSAAALAERQQLQRQVGELTYTTVHLSQENKLLKERMRLYQYSY